MSDNNANPILVTGATGKTGGRTVQLLLQRGHRVRAFVHQHDDRSERLATAGAEIAVGDLLDIDSVSVALRQVRSAYFVYPIRDGLIEATTIFAQAGAETGVHSVVNMSQISARRQAKSNAARQHWLAERLLDWSPLAATHLRPTFFAEWLLEFKEFTEFTADEGVLRFPFGNGRHAPIATEDQARVIAAILENPRPHAGKTYRLFGPVEMNYDEIAAAVSRTLGRPVRYEPIDVASFAATLTAAGRPQHLVQHLANVAVDYQNGIFAGTNDTVEAITGSKPMTVEEFVTANRDAFDPPSTAAGGARQRSS